MKIGKYQIRSPFGSSPTKQEMPLTTGGAITPGRETEEPHDMLFTSNKYTPIEPGFAIEWLGVLEHMAAYNQDVGYAVDNIVQLANTPYEIEFVDEVSNKIKKEVIQLINQYKNSWYSFSGGFSSFRADILAQAAINGAMSVEMIPNKQLDNITLTRVPPKYIRFLYNKKTTDYEPFQQVKNPKNSEPGTYGLKKLNTVKYKYIAWRRLLEGPYPVPPFLTALRTLDIQKDMITNIAYIIEKLGMLGFLSASVEPPQKKAGEKDEAYFSRCLKYLENTVYPQLQKNLSKGIVVGFKGSHEFNMSANNMNTQGAQQLVQIVEQMLFAGLKQDPNMLGRNFSTTETFGRVILAKMTNQVKEYQTMLNTMMLDIFKLFITLRGYDPNVIMGVSCEPAMIRDKVVEQNARKTEIENAISLRNENITDQQQTANSLGYEEPADEAPAKQEPVNGDGTEKKKDDNDDEPTDDEDTQENIKLFEYRYGIKAKEYDYRTFDCDGLSMSFIKNSNFNDKQMNTFATKYSGEVNEAYSKFTINTVNSSLKAIQSLNELSPIETIQENVYLAILNDWGDYYTPKLPAITERNVENTYEHYRKDDSIFPKENGFAKSKGSFIEDFVIPDPVFGLDDFRSIEYMAESDTMYLGKFITDESTKKKLYRYLEESYINGDLPFGKDKKAMAKFKNEFGDLFVEESYKIRRIIDTSVNNIRNDANVRYIAQAELSEYEVIEIGDNLTCQYCNHMNGMVFQIDNAISKINNKVQSTPENIAMVAPFATTVKIHDFTKMNPEQLQAAGFSTPSYHASCRGRIVAKI